MRRKHFFRPILQEAWSLTWKHRGWWIFGLLSLFLVSSFSYQLVLQGVRTLTQPIELFNQWKQWSLIADPLTLLRGQIQIFQSSPTDFLVLSAVWVGIGILFLLLFALSVLAITTIISGLKQYILREKFDVVAAITEAIYHFWGVFGALFWTFVLANVLVIIFSLPVLALGLAEQTSVLATIFLFVLYAAFGILAFMLSVMAIYTIMGVVFDDLKLKESIKNAWRMLKSHLLIAIEMFFLQIIVAVIFAVILVTLVSLLVIPATFLGFYLLSSQAFNLAQLLTQATFFLLIFSFAVGGAIYTMFYLLSWGFAYLRLDKARPYSRIASFAEMILRIEQ